MSNEALAMRAGLAEKTIRNYQNDGLPADRTQFEKLRSLGRALLVSDAGLARMLAGEVPHADEMANRLEASVSALPARHLVSVTTSDAPGDAAIALDADTRAQVDHWAASEGISAADVIARLVASARSLDIAGRITELGLLSGTSRLSGEAGAEGKKPETPAETKARLIRERQTETANRPTTTARGTEQRKAAKGKTK